MSFFDVLVAAACASAGAPAGATPITLKFATLAPEGSAWMQQMRDLDRGIREKTSGRLAFKFYPGGVQGDEKDVVRKMRVGQLHGGGFTGLGLGEMSPEVRVLEVPLLAKDDAAAERVADGLRSELAAALERRGFVLVSWAHPGFAYLLTRKPARSADDFKRLKLWAWEGDPVADAVFASLGVAPIPLSLPDVLTSLQTGLIEGVYATPLAAIALQWHTRIRYLLQLPLAFVCGGMVVTKAAHDGLPRDLQALLLSEGGRTGRQLTAEGRRGNAEALGLLRVAGVESVVLSEADRIAFEARMMQARGKLAGRLFPQALLARAIELAGGR